MTVLCSVCGERLEMVEGPKGDLYLHYPSLPKSHQPSPYTLVGDDEQLVDPPAILRRNPHFSALSALSSEHRPGEVHQNPGDRVSDGSAVRTGHAADREAGDLSRTGSIPDGASVGPVRATDPTDEAFYTGLGAKLEAGLNAFLARYPKEVDEP